MLQIINLEMQNNKKKVVFSKEKSFKLDGPDEFQYYWIDKFVPNETYLTKQRREGPLMLWVLSV